MLSFSILCMGFREDIARKIEKRQADLFDRERSFEREKAAAEAYIQALQDVLKALPRSLENVRPDRILRPGGSMAKCRDLILTAGRPLPLAEILKGLGKGQDRKERRSVSSALGLYTRKGEVFVRTGPNTFGLVELGHAATPAQPLEPPSDFGILSEDDAASDDESLNSPPVDDDDDVPF